MLPVQTHLLLEGAPDPGRARLAWRTEGFFQRTRTGVIWRGGPLAERLAAAPGLSEALLSELGPHDGLSITGETGRVRVVLKRSVTVEVGIFIDGLGRRHDTPWTHGLLHAMETVAAHARGWVGS